VRKYIGAYLAALGRAEAVVFTGGVGEHSGQMRRRILEPLAGLGLVLDLERNREELGGEREISAPDSPVKLLVIPTNEELVIARDTREILGSRASH
jgi:acetate kinase